MSQASGFHGATWLNQERWADEAAEPAKCGVSEAAPKKTEYFTPTWMNGPTPI